MTNANPVLPDGIMDSNTAHETNFVIAEFRKLPVEERRRLATLILNSPPHSEELADAGTELFDLFYNLSPRQRAEYANKAAFGGEQVLDEYLILPESMMPKIICYTYYFKENLKQMGDDFVIAEITFPHRLVAA